MPHATRSFFVLSLLATACGPQPAPQPMPPSTPVVTSAPEAPPPPAAPSPVGQMAHIPEATIQMGSAVGEADEMPVHPVHVAAFDLDRTETTVAQYAQCVSAGGCVPAPSVVQWPGATSDDQQLSKDLCNENRPDRQDYAANCIDWNMATAYCRWAGKRLPTEAEWEYAACAGDCNQVIHSKVGKAVVHGATRWAFSSRVPSGAPGPFGLYDMAGNVWEWTSSPYCAYDRPDCSDPRRVVRGGSWSMVDFLFVRLTDRSASDPSNRNTNLGFRCARNPQ